MVVTFLISLAGFVLFSIYGVLIAWYRRAWKDIPVFIPHRAATISISVLIPARNEEQNIGVCLRSLAGQSYPREFFEVIVIDDHSTDDTTAIVSSFAAHHPAPPPGSSAAQATSSAALSSSLNLRCLRLADLPRPEGLIAHKKFAIETGVAAAYGELIVTTDADCVFQPDWLSTMASFYLEKEAKFVAAPVRIAVAPRHRTFLSIFQTLDFITLQGITGASVNDRFHSMCNGANLAYARSAFDEVEGYKGIDSIPSGDDMLLMHKIYLRHPDKVFFLKSRQAIVSTRPETRWRGFFNQRIRWASKADSYDDRRIFRVLLLVYLVNIFFAGLLVASFWNTWWLWLLLCLLALKTIVEYPFVRTVAAFFGQQELMAYFPLLQPFHIIYTIVVGWLGKFGSYDWKDRKITK
jgi:cellulose synthase/poly-beta-1,6-N-acetylglucosamine synthase-like glycosyltransferase